MILKSFTNILLAVLIMNSILSYSQTTFPQLPKEETLKPCEIKMLALLTFNAALKTIAKEESFSESQCVYLKYKQEQPSVPPSHIPGQPPGIPPLPPHNPFPGQYDRRLDSLLSQLPIENQTPFRSTNIADALGNMVLSYAIYEQISDEPCLPNSSTQFARWDKLFRNKFSIYTDSKEFEFLKDDRTEFQDIEDILRQHIPGKDLKTLKQYQQMKSNWESMVMVVHDSILEDRGQNILIRATRLKDQTVDGLPFCADIAFGDQFAPYIQGTGFFIGENTIATAAHLFGPETEDCHERNLCHYRFIRGVTLGSTMENTGILVSKKQVFIAEKTKSKKCIQKIKKGQCEQGTYDWALIKVKPLLKKGKNFGSDMLINGSIAPDSTPVYTFGHGIGLPLKFNFDGKIWASKRDDIPYIYYSQLDMFGGNSGSPVFDANTHQLLGILTAGADDFEHNGHCMKFKEYLQSADEAIQGIMPVLQAMSSKSAVKASFKMQQPARFALTGCSQSRSEAIRSQAPYVYLNQNTSGQLTVCVLTYTQPGKRLHRDTIYPGNQTKIISYSIINDTNSTATYQSDTVRLLNPTDIQVIEVRIDTLTAKLKKSDADTASMEFAGKTCLNAPYTYLRVDKGNIYYSPHLLIPVKGCTGSLSAQSLNCTGYSCTYLLNNCNSADSTITYLSPESTNLIRYKGTVKDNNSQFVVIVELPATDGGPKKIKKTTHDQNNADKKPRSKPKSRK